MANLTWLAIDTGHYAVLTIEPGTTELYNTGLASYNLVKIFPTSMYVNNSGNSVQLTINYRNTPAFAVPAFSSTPIQLTGDGVLSIENTGGADVVIILSDHELPGYISQLFASLSISAGESNQTLLNHFEDGLLNNSGSGEGYVYELFGESKTSGIAKFQERSLSLLDNGIPGETGIVITKAGGFDMSKDFTLDAWFYPSEAGGATNPMVFFMFNALSTNTADSISLSVASSQLKMIINGTQNTIVQAIPSSTWQQLAISKINNKFYVFHNGDLRMTITDNISDVFDTLSIGYTRISSIPTFRNIPGKIDEFRYLADIGLNESTFVPPAQPYF